MPKSKDDNDKENVKPKPKPKEEKDQDKDISPTCQPDVIGYALENLFIGLDKLKDKCVKTIIGRATELKMGEKECIQALQNRFDKDGHGDKQEAGNFADLPLACENALKAFKLKPAGPRPQQKSEGNDQSDLKDQLKISNLKAGYMNMGIENMTPEIAESAAQFHHGQEKNGVKISPKEVGNAFVQSGGDPKLAAVNLLASKAPEIAGGAMPSKKLPNPLKILPPNPLGKS